MREKKMIVKLSAKLAAGAVAFPQKVNVSFYNFRHALADVLRENDLGGASGGAWEWDEESQTFYATWTRREVVEGVGVELERGVDLDPRKPLEEEIERLLRLRRAFDQFAIRAFGVVRADAIKLAHERQVAEGA